MNIQEYISSGVLELYVLGELSPEESADVEKMARTYEEVKNEIRSIEESLAGYAKTFAKTPSSDVKTKIFAQLEEESETKVISKITHYKKEKKRFYLVAASLALAILFAGSTLYYWSKWRTTERNFIALQKESTEYANNYNKVKSDYEGKLDQLQNYVAVLNDKATESVILKGLPSSPKSEAKVIWNKENKIVYLSRVNLPPPPAGKQYQLWALYNDEPIDAGVIVKGGSEIQRMKDILSAQAFAITLEKEGGSPTPNLEALYVMGKI